MIIKQIIKKFYLKNKGLYIDFKTKINFDVYITDNDYPSRIVDSFVQLKSIGCGCFIEHAYIYGKNEIGNHVSISGPGTVIHSEVHDVKIGNYVSIAPGVKIVEFNHEINKPTTFAVNFNIYKKEFREDVQSKGSVVIEDDVWIGSNAVILSGVKIGRGSIIGGGAVVTKDVEPYSILIGVPAKVIRKRFNNIIVKRLEETKWWKWNKEQIEKNEAFFNQYIGKDIKNETI